MLRTRWQCRSSSLLKKQQKIGIKERLQQNTRKNKCLGLGSPRNRSRKGSGCKRLKWEGTSGNTGQLNGKTGKRRKEADIKCLIKVGVTGAQSLWRTWGEMVALRICQVKQIYLLGYLSTISPGLLLRAASVGIYALAFPAPSNSLWGMCQ